MQVRALSKGVHNSPRKVSVVASLVRGRSVNDALVILSHTPRRSAEPVAKAIKSARANAENNHNLKPDTLKIASITVTHGVRLKRFNPAAHGRALPFMRRSSHICVVLEGEERVIKKVADASKSVAEKAKTEAK
jgi:large subunit ribosomal protein L22